MRNKNIFSQWIIITILSFVLSSLCAGEISRAEWLKSNTKNRELQEALTQVQKINYARPTLKDAESAARSGDLEAMKKLKAGGFSDWKNAKIMTAALQTPFLDVVKFLVANGADVNTVCDYAVFMSGFDFNTPAVVVAAECSNNAEIVKFLLDNGADLKAKGLLMAACCSNLETVKLVVERGCNVNETYKFKQTALHIAAIKGNPAIVSFLISKNVNVNAVDTLNQETPLFGALHGKNKDIAKILLAAGANPNMMNRYRRLPADFNTDPELAVMLKPTISRPFDPKMSRLLLKASNTQGVERKIFENLLIKGADPTVKNSDGMMPVHIAAMRGNIEAVTFLCAQGIDINAPDDRGMTPLHWAAFCGQQKLVEEIVKFWDADITAKDKKGHTAVNFAAAQQQREIVRFLTEYAAQKK